MSHPREGSLSPGRNHWSGEICLKDVPLQKYIEVKQLIGDFKMTATTLFGLEEVLAKELLRLGAREIEVHNRAVSFVGDKGFMYKANFCLRTALRILVPVETLRVTDENSLYRQVQSIDWSEYLTPKDTLAIDTSLNTRLFNHTQYVSQKTKDAIVDQFRNKHGIRPSVDLDHPTLRINLHIFQDTLTIALDSSGQPLYKRGYRDHTNLAPLNEVLAAGMLLLSGWEKHIPLIDPFCGSGTFLIEAALLANNIPPGYYRAEFGFERWKDFDETLWNTIREGAINKIDSFNPSIWGSDISPNLIKKAKHNIKEAKVEDVVKVKTCSFQDLDPPTERGMLIMNPPYGERMDKDDTLQLYKEIGSTLKKKYTGFDAWIISSNKEAFNQIGLHASRRIQLFNGQLECRFMKYQMYSGSKKTKYTDKE
jgi:putative N6-adenine-specific DNA methylase